MCPMTYRDIQTSDGRARPGGPAAAVGGERRGYAGPRVPGGGEGFAAERVPRFLHEQRYPGGTARARARQGLRRKCRWVGELGLGCTMSAAEGPAHGRIANQPFDIMDSGAEI